MITRSQFYQLALEANERQANVRDDVLPVPTLDERVSLYLRAVHGNREFTEEERSNARNALLDSMATEITAQVQPKVTEPQPLHPYEAPTQYWQSVPRRETIRVVSIARRRTSVLALTATLGLVLIVAGGTLGYRWTNPYIEEEASEPSQQDRVPLPTLLARSRLGLSPRSSMWCRSHHDAARPMCSRFFAGCNKSSQHCLVRQLSAALILARRVTAREWVRSHRKRMLPRRAWPSQPLKSDAFDALGRVTNTP
jgi:hypothetical protein